MENQNHREHNILLQRCREAEFRIEILPLERKVAKIRILNQQDLCISFAKSLRLCVK